jgi:hypothetical protein
MKTVYCDFSKYGICDIKEIVSENIKLVNIAFKKKVKEAV